MCVHVCEVYVWYVYIVCVFNIFLKSKASIFKKIKNSNKF
jgi:hypothetical protein